jgi:hypothetical protein
MYTAEGFFPCESIVLLNPTYRRCGSNENGVRYLNPAVPRRMKSMVTPRPQLPCDLRFRQLVPLLNRRLFAS